MEKEMLKKKKNFSLLKVVIFLALVLVVFFGISYGYGQAAANKSNVAILQGSIDVKPAKLLPGDPNKIQPGTSVKLSVIVENKGQKASPSGELYIRYAFTKPLDNQPSSIIFHTEKLPVPVIEPGKKTEIHFTSTQQLPSLGDFIRYDWPMREYQAIFITNQSEVIIGNLAITFSAYYYPGLKHEIPKEIPSSDSFDSKDKNVI
jgi:hypothetical protein